MPRVSIIIPTYNCAATLEETLESVYSQDYNDWEVILFDDGSTDDTLDIAYRAVKKRPGRILSYSHDEGGNHGPARTRNRASRIARGEFLAFLDGDDLWMPGFLSNRVGWLDRHPGAAMVWGPVEYFGERIKSYKQPTSLNGSITQFESPRLVELFARDARATPCPTSALLRRAPFFEVDGFDEELRRGEDIALWIKIASRCTIVYDDRVMARYRRHTGSSTSRTRDEGTKALLELEYQEWLLTYLRNDPRFFSLIPSVEQNFHFHAHQHAAGGGWMERRLQVSKTLARVPGLLRSRWWSLVLDWLFPFDFSRRVSAKLSSWFGG